MSFVSVAKKMGICKYKLIPLYDLEKRKLRNLNGYRPALLHKNKTVQKLWSLKSEWPEIYDQGQIGSCTANAFCGAFKFLIKDSFEPSRLYVYYKERYLEHPDGPITDSGAWVIDAYNWVSQHGVCPERLWPYDISKVNVPPPKDCDDNPESKKVKGYYPLSLGENLKNTIGWCLVQNRPVLMAFGVYKSFTEIGLNGVCPVPKPQKYEDYNDPIDPFYGGHEVVIVGFDDDKKLYTVANSWGSDWGDKGFFYMPYDFVDNARLVYDFGAVVSAF